MVRCQKVLLKLVVPLMVNHCKSDDAITKAYKRPAKFNPVMVVSTFHSMDKKLRSTNMKFWFKSDFYRNQNWEFISFLWKNMLIYIRCLFTMNKLWKKNILLLIVSYNQLIMLFIQTNERPYTLWSIRLDRPNTIQMRNRLWCKPYACNRRPVRLAFDILDRVSKSLWLSPLMHHPISLRSLAMCKQK